MWQVRSHFHCHSSMCDCYRWEHFHGLQQLQGVHIPHTHWFINECGDTFRVCTMGRFMWLTSRNQMSWTVWSQPQWIWTNRDQNPIVLSPTVWKPNEKVRRQLEQRSKCKSKARAHKHSPPKAKKLPARERSPSSITRAIPQLHECL